MGKMPLSSRRPIVFFARERLREDLLYCERYFRAPLGYDTSFPPPTLPPLYFSSRVTSFFTSFSRKKDSGRSFSVREGTWISPSRDLLISLPPPSLLLLKLLPVTFLIASPSEVHSDGGAPCKALFLRVLLSITAYSCRLFALPPLPSRQTRLLRHR